MLHALRQLSTITSALSHRKELVPNNVSIYSDVDVYSRASRVYLIIINKNSAKLIYFNYYNKFYLILEIYYNN